MAMKDDTQGPLRKLLGKVVGRVVDAALGTSRPPPSPEATDGQEARRPAFTTPSPRRPSVPSFEEVEPVAVSAMDGGGVRLSWTLTEEALDRARRVLGEEGELRARLVVVARDEAQVVASQVHEKGDVASEGEWLVRDVPRGARCTAAVGLGRGERFVSAAHARVLAL